MPTASNAIALVASNARLVTSKILIKHAKNALATIIA